MSSGRLLPLLFLLHPLLLESQFALLITLRTFALSGHYLLVTVPRHSDPAKCD